jgi:AcrR family transcriptional regulator
MSTSEAPRTAREPADDKRRRILEAARVLCARDGYEAATMDGIAAEARVSKGTLYNHFESKEQLFLCTQLQAYEEAQERVDARVGDATDPRERLEGLLDALVEVFPAVTAGMSVNLQVWAVISRSAEARTRMYEALRRQYAASAEDLRDTLRAGQREGCFRADLDVEGVVAGLAAVFDGFVYRAIFDPDHADGEGLRRALDVLVRQRIVEQER